MAPPSHVLEHGAHCDQVDHSGSSGSLVLSKKQTLATIMIGNEIDRLHSSNHSTWSLPHEYIIIFCVYIYIYSSQHKTGEEGFGDDDKWRLSSVLKGKDDVDGRVRELYRAVVSLFIVYFDGALAMPREIDTQRKKDLFTSSSAKSSGSSSDPQRTRRTIIVEMLCQIVRQRQKQKEKSNKNTQVSYLSRVVA